MIHSKTLIHCILRMKNILKLTPHNKANQQKKIITVNFTIQKNIANILSILNASDFEAKTSKNFENNHSKSTNSINENMYSDDEDDNILS